MNIAYSAVDDIAQLAYLVRIDRSGVNVLHGRSVAVEDDRISDGIWAAPFRGSRIDPSMTFLAGTVAFISDGGVELASPRNPVDRFFIVSVGSAVLVSNSLPFLLAATDDELDPAVVTYRSLFTATAQNLRRAPRTFRTRRGRTFRVMWDEVAQIGLDGSMHFRPRSVDPPFRNFEDYYNTMHTATATLIENGRSPDRTHGFEPIVALSTGYDSCAIAALLRTNGVRSAITMIRRPDGDPQSSPVDDPSDIASQLDLDLLHVERDTWRTRTDLPDADIAAASTNFIDISLLALEPYLAGRVLFAGNSGDNIWTRDNFRAYDDVVRGDTCGQGLGEQRLRVGYAICSLPYIGHTAHSSLHRLANSAEMRPWSIGGHYDRPVPRRIVEDAGGKRESFGQKKYSGGALVGSNRLRLESIDRSALRDDLETFMTHEGARSYMDYLEEIGPMNRTKWTILRGGNWLFEKITAANFRVGRRFASHGIRSVVPPSSMSVIGSRFSVYPDRGAWFPHWGTSILRDRYAKALSLWNPPS